MLSRGPLGAGVGVSWRRAKAEDAVVVGAGGGGCIAGWTVGPMPSMPGIDERLSCVVVLLVHGGRS